MQSVRGRLPVKARELTRQRVVIAWLSGPLAVVLGVAAHSLAGESVPAVWVLVALTALLSMAASIFARLQVPVWVLFLLSGLVQQVLHLAFSRFSGVVGGASSGHVHGGSIWQPPQPSSSSGHQALELMLDSHVAVALLTVLVITQSVSLLSRLRRPRRGLAPHPPPAS
jgi:hypothetical protein